MSNTIDNIRAPRQYSIFVMKTKEARSRRDSISLAQGESAYRLQNVTDEHRNEESSNVQFALQPIGTQQEVVLKYARHENTYFRLTVHYSVVKTPPSVPESWTRTIRYIRIPSTVTGPQMESKEEMKPSAFGNLHALQR